MWTTQKGCGAVVDAVSYRGLTLSLLSKGTSYTSLYMPTAVGGTLNGMNVAVTVGIAIAVVGRSALH